MRIGIVGGMDRAEPQFRRLAGQAGHQVELHRGVMSSCGASSLEAMIRRCDLVVIATDMNSHAAVRAARTIARSQGMSPLMTRRLGLGKFAELLRDLNAGASALARVDSLGVIACHSRCAHSV